jgi:glycine/D-amino acid oxidase-like deaminating enzyme
MGRRKKYTEEHWNEFLFRISEGAKAKKLSYEKDMPSWRLISDKLNSDEQFARKYSLALENRAEIYFDEVDELAKKVEKGEICPNAGRVAIDAKKWQAATNAPKKFGGLHRHEIKHTGTDYVQALKAIAEEKHTRESNTPRARGVSETDDEQGAQSLH